MVSMASHSTSCEATSKFSRTGHKNLTKIRQKERNRIKITFNFQPQYARRCYKLDDITMNMSIIRDRHHMFVVEIERKEATNQIPVGKKK